MREEKRAARRKQIEAAAYRLLAEHGYDGTSMLSIAKQAKASNETLYRWYGDKQGLFKALVEQNAQDVKAFLEDELAIERSPQATLAALSPKLLGLLIGPKAIALNRAAASDASGMLGAAISQAGREAILPLIVNLFAAARDNGHLNTDHSPAELAEIYINLLVGDLQIRHVIGSVGKMSKADIERRSKTATALFFKAIAPDQ